MVVVKKHMLPVGVLVTSVSAKVPLIRVLKVSLEEHGGAFRVVGADVDEKVLGRFFVDEFWLLPRLEELEITRFISECYKKRIRYIVPTRDEDVVFFACHKKTLENSQIYPLVAEQKAVSFCVDKLRFSKEGGQPLVVESSETPEALLTDRYVVKERTGSGSRNIAVDVKESTALSVASRLKSPIFQPFISGGEFSVDSYVTRQGKCLGSVFRSRDMVVDGESKVTSTVQVKEITKKRIQGFLLKHRIFGHSVLQYIQTQEGPRIIECNPRFGGASTLSHQANLKSFLWFIQEVESQRIETLPLKVGLCQVRVAADTYIESKSRCV